MEDEKLESYLIELNKTLRLILVQLENLNIRHRKEYESQYGRE